MKQIQFICLLIITFCWTSCSSPSLPPKASEPSIPTVEVMTLHPQTLKSLLHLPGQMYAYESVDVYPKVSGFLSSISVDRGSIVKAGQVLAQLTAPEIQSQVQEAQSKVGTSQAQISEAQSKYEALENTYQRLKEAGQTPGAVAPNELQVAQKNTDAALRNVQALKSGKYTAQAGVRSLKSIRDYLYITAPFDGIVTERNLHPGSLVGPGGSNTVPIVHLEKISHLRLVIYIPEANVGGITEGMPVKFTVPAFPDEQLTASVSRISYALDPKTRTEAVELDVQNPKRQLTPGMYADVSWSVHRSHPTFVVPATAVVSTTQRTFVIRVKDGHTEWVDVNRGNTVDNRVEVFGSLHEGDRLVTHATDEFRTGTRIKLNGAS